METTSADILAAQRQAYGENFAQHGATPRGNYWPDIESQWLRFERLLHHLREELPESSIHDLGCGTCGLHDYLLKSNIPHRYSGTEIVPEMIAHATREYPEITVHDRDFLQVEDEFHDFIFTSGMLNLKLATPQALWHQWSMKIITRMFQLAKQASAFNFLTAHPTLDDPDLMIFDPQEILGFCRENLSRFVILDTGYPLYECTVTVFKPEFVKRLHPGKSHRRYFA